MSVDFFGKDIYFSKYKQLEKLHRGIVENGRENDLWYLAQQIDGIINFVIQEGINDNPIFNAKFTLNRGMFELDITFKNRDEFFDQIIKAVGEKMNAARANKNDKREQSYADYLQKMINVLQRAKSARTDGLDISSYVIKQKKKKKGKDSGDYSKEYNEFDYDYFKEIDIYEYEIISEIRFS